jgi:DNA helicase II / ATP-dependent DNA helicase PcrA
MDPFVGLNLSQREAVSVIEGPLLVVAGPGTGKTLTIVRRIAHLVQTGLSPRNIVAVTFTNRAGREIRERVRGFLENRATEIFVGTLHSLGLALLSEISGTPIQVVPREEACDMLQSIGRLRHKEAERVLAAISRAKNLLVEPDDELKPLYDLYQAELKSRGVVDFEDLILEPLRLLQEPGVASPYQNRFSHIIIDEYQDVSPSQNAFIGALLGPGRNICAVGDSDQSIYGFRGADVTNFLNFERDFPDAATIILEKSYRSTGMITAAATGIIQQNCQRIDKPVEAVRETGEPVQVLSVPDGKAEAEFIAKQIEARMGGTSHYRLFQGAACGGLEDKPCRFSDFAVLFRTNAQAAELEKTFGAWGIPYQAPGGKGISGVKKIIEYLRKTLNDPRESINTSMLLGKARQEMGSSQEWAFIEALYAAYSDRPPNEATEAIIQELILLEPADTFDVRADSVALMTFHIAKGLEFKVVFVIGMEEGITPLNRVKGEYDIEEERRLFYVAITRAQDEAYLLQTRQRYLYGKPVMLEPSRFLAEIPVQCLVYATMPDRPHKEQKPKQMGLF